MVDVEEREPALIDRLRAENATLSAELERIRARDEAPIEPPASTKAATAKEPERFALVGPGPKQSQEAGPPDETWDALGATLCRILEQRRPETRWSYHRDLQLVPEGVTFYYAHEALRKMWGETPANAGPPEPKAYRRLTAAEQDECNHALQAALRRVDETLERSEALHAQGQEGAAVGLLKYVDLLLARFNVALARAEGGDDDWQEALNDPDRDAEVEAWVAAQVAAAG